MFLAQTREQGASLNEAFEPEPGGCILVLLSVFLGPQPCLNRSSLAQMTPVEGLHYGRVKIDPRFIRLRMYLRGRGRLVAMGTDSSSRVFDFCFFLFNLMRFVEWGGVLIF